MFEHWRLVAHWFSIGLLFYEQFIYTVSLWVSESDLRNNNFRPNEKQELS